MKLTKKIAVSVLALSMVSGGAWAVTASDDAALEAEQSNEYQITDFQDSGYGGGAGWHRKGMRGNQGDCGAMEQGGRGHHKKMGAMSGMHRNAKMTPEMREKLNAFLDATKDIRKELNDKRFAYREAKRNPDITVGELQKQQDELYSLRQQIKAERQKMLQPVNGKVVEKAKTE